MTCNNGTYHGGAQTVLMDSPDQIQVACGWQNYVTIYAAGQALSIGIDGMTADETIDILCAKLQATKTTEKREGE